MFKKGGEAEWSGVEWESSYWAAGCGFEGISMHGSEVEGMISRYGT